jgi:hypothetical protein
MSDFEQKARELQGRVESTVDKYGEQASGTVRPFMKKHGVKIAIGFAVLGVLLFLTLGV